MPTHDREAVELHQHQQPDQRLRHQEHDRRLDAHLPGRNRPRARALDLRVDVAIEQIVPGAARAAHHDGADQEQQHVPGIGSPLAGGDGGERRRPPARQQQQPPADRPVETGQPQIGPHPGRRDGVDPVSGRIGDASGRGAHLRLIALSGLPVERVEGAAPRLRRSRPAGSARRAHRSSSGPTGRRPRGADLLADLHRSGVLRLDLLDRIRRHAADLLVGLQKLHHPAFRADELVEQRADLFARRLAVAGGLDGAAILLGLFADRREFEANGRGLCARRWRAGARPAR